MQNGILSGIKSTGLHILDVSGASVLLGGWAAVYLNKYFVDDIYFSFTISLLIIVETIVSAIRAKKEKRFSSKWMDGPLFKVTLVALGLTSLHAVAIYFEKTSPQLADMFGYIDGIAYSYVILKECVAIHEGLSALGYPIIPLSILKRIRRNINDTFNPPRN